MGRILCKNYAHKMHIKKLLIYIRVYNVIHSLVHINKIFSWVDLFVCVCVLSFSVKTEQRKKRQLISEIFIRGQSIIIRFMGRPCRCAWCTRTTSILFLKWEIVQWKKNRINDQPPSPLVSVATRRRQQPQAQQRRIRVHIIFSFLFCITFRDIILQHDDMANFRNFTTFPLSVRIYA